MNSDEKNQTPFVQQNVIVEDEANYTYEEHGTFCRVGSSTNGILEVDLQSLKQKGVEIRNISFAIPLGVDDDNNPVKAEMLFMDEESFNKFKNFISKLNWND